MATETPEKTDAENAPSAAESAKEVAAQAPGESSPKLPETSSEEPKLPVSYPASILYARGDALAACRMAQKVLDQPTSSDPDASSNADQNNATLFLRTVGTDSMTKIVATTSLFIIIVTILILYVF